VGINKKPYRKMPKIEHSKTEKAQKRWKIKKRWKENGQMPNMLAYLI
jgi:hypothetical protein